MNVNDVENLNIWKVVSFKAKAKSIAEKVLYIKLKKIEESKH